jgi:hypothetical protein
MSSHFRFFFFFFGAAGLNLALPCKAGALLVEPHFQLILLWLFWEHGLEPFAWVSSNCDPSNLSMSHQCPTQNSLM